MFLYNHLTSLFLLSYNKYSYLQSIPYKQNVQDIAFLGTWKMQDVPKLKYYCDQLCENQSCKRKLHLDRYL